MQQPRIFFAVALHEKYALPTDALYTPIQAGAAIHPPLGLMRDDTGEKYQREERQLLRTDGAVLDGAQC